MTRSCFDKFLDELDRILQNVPVPLIEPMWYPGIPTDQERVREFLSRLGDLLRELVEMVVRQLEDEGFFEENPMIRVYPRYRDASGVVVYYKGEKVFERWINAWSKPVSVRACRIVTASSAMPSSPRSSGSRSRATTTVWAKSTRC